MEEGGGGKEGGRVRGGRVGGGKEGGRGEGGWEGGGEWRGVGESGRGLLLVEGENQQL